MDINKKLTPILEIAFAPKELPEDPFWIAENLTGRVIKTLTYRKKDGSKIRTNVVFRKKEDVPTGSLLTYDVLVSERPMVDMGKKQARFFVSRIDGEREIAWDSPVNLNARIHSDLSELAVEGTFG